MAVAKNRQNFKFKFRQLVFCRIKPKLLTNRLIVKNVSKLYTSMLGKIPEVCNLFANFVEFRKKSRERIEELIKGDATVVIVSHSKSIIKSMCDRVYGVSNGEIVTDGDLDSAFEFYESEKE